MGKECQKLTAQPRALAGSMEVDGYENPEAENQGFTSRGGIQPAHSFDLRRGRVGSPPNTAGLNTGVFAHWGRRWLLEGGAMYIWRWRANVLGRVGMEGRAVVRFSWFHGSGLREWLECRGMVGITRCFYHCSLDPYKLKKGSTLTMHTLSLTSI